MDKRIIAWTAASPGLMSVLQRKLVSKKVNDHYSIPASFVATGDKSRIDEAEAEAFLQAYIEGVAQQLAVLCDAQQDSKYALPGEVWMWPSVWMTKVVGMAKEGELEDLSSLLTEDEETGIHTIGLSAADLYKYTWTQIQVQVSLADIQAAMAYLVISAKSDVVKDQILFDKEEAYKILDAYRTANKDLIHIKSSAPNLSVIRQDAIR